jgi:hypothetical protein
VHFKVFLTQRFTSFNGWMNGAIRLPAAFASWYDVSA